WNDKYIETNGVGAATFLSSQRIIRLLTQNKEVIDAVHGSTAGRTMVTLAELRGILEAEGLPIPRAPYDASLRT
ncbi:MAG TPA: hypothetical protein PLV68_14085, partial [Ilumatobacteraceae bacterium]|nr:hypothetical protein [Ilumatobacteraceae bacterium]